MSIIYKLYCKDPSITDFYIGSTNNLNMRKIKHKYCVNHINSKSKFRVYDFIRTNGGWNNFTFVILLQLHNVMIQQDLRRIEGAIIKLLQPTLNERIAGRTLKEYYKDNIISITKYKTTKVCCKYCNMFVRRDNIARHQKTKSCISIQNTNQI
tara:strand:+ start:80 stop:538 length:459 start_codon:yes stop_codon:yes gene_type:complete